MKRAVYMMVSRDKYELPMAVADTLKEPYCNCGAKMDGGTQ